MYSAEMPSEFTTSIIGKVFYLDLYEGEVGARG